jgi:hypothetical protein
MNMLLFSQGRVSFEAASAIHQDRQVFEMVHWLQMDQAIAHQHQ